MPAAQLALTVTLNLALAVAVGAGTSALWAAGNVAPWAVRLGSRVRLAALFAFAVAMLASACSVWLTAAAMAEVPVTQAGSAAWSMLTATHLGTAWAIGMAALIACMGAMALRRGRLAALSLLGLAVFLYTRSMVSHASADGDLSLLMFADWLHLICICLWVGEVFVAGLLTLSSAPGARTDDRDACAHYVEALSTTATIALAGLAATGLFNAWHNLGSPAALTGDPYGKTLLIKVALVVCAVVLGGFNRFIVMPSLTSALRRGAPGALPVLRRFRLVLRIEAAVLLGVLVLAAILSSTPPPVAAQAAAASGLTNSST